MIILNVVTTINSIKRFTLCQSVITITLLSCTGSLSDFSLFLPFTGFAAGEMTIKNGRCKLNFTIRDSTR